MSQARVDSGSTVEDLVAASVRGRRSLAAADAWQRREWLDALAAVILDRAEALAAAISADIGKPRKWAQVEVERAASIIRLSAAECLTLHPHAQKLDAQPSGSGRLAITVREPRGTVLALCPFNFPLHLTVHKVAPAIAVGAPVIVVPSPRAPRTAAGLRSALADAGIPEGVVSFAEPDADHRRTWQLIDHPDIPVVSFTGSDAVGWRIVDAVPRKQVIAELGGNAAVVLAPDAISTPDVASAAERIALFGFYNAGQACTSVQRVYVPAGRLDSVVEALSARAEAQDQERDVGPVVDDAAAERIRGWLREAQAGGARIATGGFGTGRWIPPTVVAGPQPGARIVTEEVFGPVVSVLEYADLGDAFGQVNDSRYGLSAGIFTHDVRTARRAARELRTGQVVVGDVPTYRSDVTAFGGIKESGRGREGVRATMDDYTQSRTVVYAESPL